MNASSQTYQNGTNLSEYLSREEKNNDIVDGTENPSEPGKQLDNHQDSNTASLNKGNLSAKMSLICQKEIYLGLKFPCYPNV